ncbi:carbohydrate ABC transporter permease [Paenibacillus roseipurpureus]|uniref:Carbohydrate ABC transporter permease n=1 Tax=Paenibacillus roseopurpureus TaxID=2918901 RepID=A0AA96RL18_9BACL|nr:carbohydrate ABC transporter permease [Paenibacillus sp. MBLB1832]WNR45290.1 carbohydrate ABC transporter permease [Paenibacillus sp. MBLB1832]
MRTQIRLSLGDRLVHIAAVAFVLAVAAATLYPFLYVFSSSISDPKAVIQNKVLLLPVGFSLKAYEILLHYRPVRVGFLNSIFYTVVGTFINMALTSLMAYPLSRKSLFGRKAVMWLVTFTLLFNGGMIPTYLVVKELGLLDTRWALLLPGAIATWNLILLKTFFESIPRELEEAATIDGCSSMQTLLRIVIPLSMPAIATISLFYAVAHWNSWFDALVYLTDHNLYPIQMFLRSIVISSQTADMMGDGGASLQDMLMTESIKYATIMTVAIPMMIIYPFVQRYFNKGAMIGSLKG